MDKVCTAGEVSKAQVSRSCSSSVQNGSAPAATESHGSVTKEDQINNPPPTPAPVNTSKKLPRCQTYRIIARGIYYRTFEIGYLIFCRIKYRGCQRNIYCTYVLKILQGCRRGRYRACMTFGPGVSCSYSSVDTWGLKAERPLLKSISQLRCKADDVLIFIFHKHIS